MNVLLFTETGRCSVGTLLGDSFIDNLLQPVTPATPVALAPQDGRVPPASNRRVGWGSRRRRRFRNPARYAFDIFTNLCTVIITFGARKCLNIMQRAPKQHNVIICCFEKRVTTSFVLQLHLSLFIRQFQVETTPKKS